MLTIVTPPFETSQLTELPKLRLDMPSDVIRRVLSEYGEPFASAPFVHHPSSGLSGARLWRSNIGNDRYVLRRWPDGQMSVGRLEWIHEMVDRAIYHGVTFVPRPVDRRELGTFVEQDGTLWQLEPWLPGAPDLTDPPQLEKVAATVEALACFHHAVCGTEPNSRQPSDGILRHVGAIPVYGPSPALLQRAELLDEMMKCGIGAIRESPAFLAPCEPWTGIAMIARTWLDESTRRAYVLRCQIAGPLEVERRLQPVLRDVTRDHVLFTGDTVTGLVDFGAMEKDHVTVDLARLAGSYGGGPVIVERIWRTYQAAKHEPRLTNEDCKLIALLDRSGVLVAAYRWLRWIFVEERSFADPQAVVSRIGKLIARAKAFETEM